MEWLQAGRILQKAVHRVGVAAVTCCLALLVIVPTASARTEDEPEFDENGWFELRPEPCSGSGIKHEAGAIPVPKNPGLVGSVGFIPDRVSKTTAYTSTLTWIGWFSPDAATYMQDGDIVYLWDGPTSIQPPAAQYECYTWGIWFVRFHTKIYMVGGGVQGKAVYYSQAAGSEQQWSSEPTYGEGCSGGGVLKTAISDPAKPSTASLMPPPPCAVTTCYQLWLISYDSDGNYFEQLLDSWCETVYQ